MKDDIRQLAVRLFTLNGYRGVSFGDLTEVLSTTRANIHYHYGSKNGLAEDVLDTTAREVIETYRSIWINPKSSLKGKLSASYDFNASRYALYNSGGEGKIWSLIVRFRMERDVITPVMIEKLNEVTLQNEISIGVGVRQAIESGELAEDAPEKDIACLISGVVHFAPLISQAPHNLARLKQTYESLSRMIDKAYVARNKKALTE